MVSLRLESSTEATMHKTLDCFFFLLYHKLMMSAKWGDPTCEVFNTFLDVFRSKLLALLDDVKQFFLWAAAVALDGRKIGFHWLKLVWENHGE